MMDYALMVVQYQNHSFIKRYAIKMNVMQILMVTTSLERNVINVAQIAMLAQAQQQHVSAVKVD